MYILGIDVSKHNGSINHSQAAAAGAKFAFVRCTVGDYYTDPRFAENWFGFKEAGLLVSAYMVPMPTNWQGTPIPYQAQVDKFKTAFGDRKPYMPVAIDAEVDHNKKPDFLTSLFENTARQLQDFAGFPFPYIYTRKTWWDPNILPAKFWKNYPLWTAHYTTSAQPWIPRGWETWSGWQFSSKGKGPDFGAEEDYIDLNWMKSEDYLRYKVQTGNDEDELIPVWLDIGKDSYEGKVEKVS